MSYPALLQRNENIALLKAEKAKTVASGFKFPELVNFLLCFAELNENDLIEHYCLGVHINNHKIHGSSFSSLQRISNYDLGLGLSLSAECGCEKCGWFTCLEGGLGRNSSLEMHVQRGNSGCSLDVCSFIFINKSLQFRYLATGLDLYNVS